MEKQDNIRAIWLRLFALLAVFTGLAGCSGDDDKTNVSPEISLNKTNLVLEVGSTERLTASFNPPEAPNKGHTWTSSAANIATVDETGMVTAVAVGNAVITAQALDGGKMASCNVQVVGEVVHVAGITLNHTDETLVAGEQLQLRATINPTNATDQTVKWMSSDEAVVTVNSSGLVTAIAEGNATVTATSNDGSKTASCQLKVMNNAPVFTGTNFTPTDVYENKLVLVSPLKAGDSVEEVDICFGTSPTPTVTSGDVATATVEGDGLLHLTLEGLKAATTYYIRSYKRTGTTFEYNDDEVAVSTFGKDIQTEYRYLRWTYETFEGLSPYFVYSKVNYKINVPGTYLVEQDEGTSIYRHFFAKDNSYSDAIYVEAGEGTFNCKVYAEGRQSRLWYYMGMTFTNLETSIRYHSPRLSGEVNPFED